MEPLTDPIALRRFHPGLTVLHVLQGQVKLILVVLSIPTKTPSPIGEDPEERNPMPLIKGQYPVVEQIGRHQGILPIIDLGEPHFAVRINERLLVNPSYSL